MSCGILEFLGAVARARENPARGRYHDGPGRHLAALRGGAGLLKRDLHCGHVALLRLMPAAV